MKENSDKVGNGPGENTEGLRTTRWWHKIKEPAFLESIFYKREHTDEYIEPYIHEGQVVVDLGCGWGHYSMLLATKVGSDGKVYAIDILDKCVKKVLKRARKNGLNNIEARAASAENLNFIDDKSVDFVIANGLLCSMTGNRKAAVSEIERILDPNGAAFLSLGAAPPMGLVDEREWHAILDRFTVVAGGPFKDLWVIVKLKPVLT